MPLKLILVSPDGAVAANGKARVAVVHDLCKFIARVAARGVQVAIWSRHLMTLDGEALDAYLSRVSGVPVRQLHAGTPKYPVRQKSGSVEPILSELGVQRHETILVGSNQSDLQAGVNNELLLLRPAWYGEQMDYGFPVTSIGDLARFCELFALREHPIYWSIDDASLQARSMGPFSTYIQAFAEFGADAKQVAKGNGANTEFWFLMIVSSLYFSGLIHGVHYICPYPGHDPAAAGGTRELLDEVMSRFAKCVRKPYLPDLIVRHTKSQKSQYLKPAQKTFLNQVNSIHLNRKPHSYDRPEPRKTPLALSGKRVLVVDDFLTNGRSLDSARAYIEAAGASAFLFSWLKTINTAFLHMKPDPELKPFSANELRTEPDSDEYSYHPHVVDRHAPQEIQRIFEAYRSWSWP